MRILIKEIIDCKSCPFLRNVPDTLKMFCLDDTGKSNDRMLDTFPNIPEWCPLPKAEPNADPPDS